MNNEAAPVTPERIAAALSKLLEAIKLVQQSNEPPAVKEKAINRLKEKARVIAAGFTKSAAL